jgi:hypothetical protein
MCQADCAGMVSSPRFGLVGGRCEGRQAVDAERLAQDLRWLASLQPIALVRALLVVVGDEDVEGPLEFVGRHVRGHATIHAESLV